MNDARGNAVWRRGRADFSEIFFGLQETNERRFRDAVGGLHGHYERAIYPRSARVILPTSVNDRRTFAFGDRPRATRPAAPGAILARFAPGARNRRVAIRPASFAPAASACFGVSVVAVRRPAFARAHVRRVVVRDEFLALAALARIGLQRARVRRERGAPHPQRAGASDEIPPRPRVFPREEGPDPSRDPRASRERRPPSRTRG